MSHLQVGTGGLTDYANTPSVVIVGSQAQTLDVGTLASTAIQPAIEALYEVFARYPLVARMRRCAHCGLETAERRLHAAPLRELSAIDLRPYAFKAISTFGGVDEFRHFLPRIAELIALERAIGACDFGVLIRKIDYAGWIRWPQPEQDVVIRWLAAVEEVSFAGVNGGDVAIRELWTAAQMRGAQSGFVDRWFAAPSEHAHKDLTHAVAELAGRSQRGQPLDDPELPSLMPHIDKIRDVLAKANRDRPSQDFQYAMDLMNFPPFISGTATT